VKNGVAVSSFTQADIDNGLITYHETASGVSSDSFSFTVADSAGNTTSGQFNLQIDSTGPVLSQNKLLLVGPGKTVAITSSFLQATDQDNTDSQLTYTILFGGPSHGTLLKNGVAVSSFTQADIDNGLISYHETASGVSFDSFTFSVADPAGSTTSGQFSLEIDSTAPVLSQNNPLMVGPGKTVAITSSFLQATKWDNTDSQLTYTITAGPSDGTVVKNGVAVSTFTQADIDNGLISYQETASGVSSDSFSFTVADSVGNTTSGQFNLQIDSTAPVLSQGNPLTVGAGRTMAITSSFLQATDQDNTDTQLT
jgi:phage antirepressor YoqD-like protein